MEANAANWIPRRIKVYNYSPDVKEVIDMQYLGHGRSGGRKGNQSHEVTDEDRERNIKRVKRNCRRLAFANELTVHMVLTYRENMQDVDKSDDNFKRFMRELHKLYPHLKYLATREFQKRGAIHYHVLLNHRVSRDKVQKLWKHGFISLMQHQNKLKAVMYVLKYISKEFGQTVMTTKNGQTKKAYLSSHGLKDRVEGCILRFAINNPDAYVYVQDKVNFMMTNLTEGWDMPFEVEVGDIKLQGRSMLKCAPNYTK